MDSETLLREISDYCRMVGMAESTFGRRAVNDGKFVNRLRYGGRVTLTTVERVHSFINNGPQAPREGAARHLALAAVNGVHRSPPSVQ